MIIFSRHVAIISTTPEQRTILPIQRNYKHIWKQDQELTWMNFLRTGFMDKVIHPTTCNGVNNQIHLSSGLVSANLILLFPFLKCLSRSMLL